MADHSESPAVRRPDGAAHYEAAHCIEEAARQVGLVLHSDHLPGVREHFARLTVQAGQLLAFPLDEQTLPPEVYEP